jgi:hypothetical protein
MKRVMLVLFVAVIIAGAFPVSASATDRPAAFLSAPVCLVTGDSNEDLFWPFPAPSPDDGSCCTQCSSTMYKCGSMCHTRYGSTPFPQECVDGCKESYRNCTQTCYEEVCPPA